MSLVGFWYKIGASLVRSRRGSGASSTQSGRDGTRDAIRSRRSPDGSLFPLRAHSALAVRRANENEKG